MLAPEARPVGKRLDKRAATESKEQAREKESMRQKKKGLGKKGLSLEELASRCADIEREMMEQRQAHLAKTADLTLPSKQTAIVERRVPKEKPQDWRRRALVAMLGSQEAQEAILAAEKVESAERDLFYEFDDLDEPMDHDSKTRDEIEVALLRWRHACTRLTAAFPNAPHDCLPDGSCEHRRSCPCGRGLRGAWPWVVQTP